jgi:hypothetical protein
MGDVKARGHRYRVTVAGAFAAALLVTACGSGGGSSPTPSPSTAAPASSAPSSPAAAAAGPLCQDLANLRTSLQQLSPDKIKAAGVSTVPAALTQVQTDLTTLIGDAHGQWQGQTGALRASVGQLQTAAKNLAASPSTSQTTAVLTALGLVAASAQQLLAVARTDCPSAAASPSS